MPQPILRLLFLLSISIPLSIVPMVAEACSPWSALGVSSNVVGTNLQLNFTSNTGWNCCYRVDIEVVCANASFTGAPNFTSNIICKNGGGGPSTTNSLSIAYQTVNVDLTQWCPGTQLKWRARETNTSHGQGSGPYTGTFNVTVPGVYVREGAPTLRPRLREDAAITRIRGLQREVTELLPMCVRWYLPRTRLLLHRTDRAGQRQAPPRQM
jgi:hypothetical protein